MQATIGLDALNFALAGAREGFGPYLGVYLQQRGFDPAATGTLMGVAGAAGLLATTPLGALIDRTTMKRGALAVAVVALALGAALLVATDNLWLIGGAQLVIGVADAAVAPLLAALTLGLVGQGAYPARLSRSEAFNHAGNAANAALAAGLGYAFGLHYVAAAIAVMAVASTLVVSRIDPGVIDHREARGGEADDRGIWRTLFGTPSLLVLAVAVFAFETANGAILPFLAQARTAAGDDPSLTTGAMTVTAQITMVGAALLAAPLARGRGQARVLALALAVVVVRGGLAALAESWWLVVPVQVLEGLAMGLMGVAMPALAAKIMRGTGNSSAGLGAVLTAFGAGATLSPVLAGFVSKALGFSAGFWALAAVAALGLAAWIVGARRYRIGEPDEGRPDGADSDGRDLAGKPAEERAEEAEREPATP